MAGTQISTSVTIINSLNGFQAVSLTNFNTSAESQIAAGSKVELASAFFTFASDEQPSGWSSIATASTAYITLTPSGSAGTQIVSAAYSSTAPEWSDSKQGWYTSALSATRYVGRVYKTSATQYDDAVVLLPHQGTTGPVVAAEKLVVSGAATVGGTLGVTGTITGTLSGSTLDASIRVSSARSILSTDNMTSGSAYSLFSALLPNVGDAMRVSGGWVRSSSTSMRIASYAQRDTASEIGLRCNTINLSGATPNTVSALGTTIETLASGSGSVVFNSCALSW